jgi:RNA polymerase sigma-70 factor (ECF subfamily)
LYAYIRRRGFSAAEAEDLTQEFFGRLLEKNALARVDRSKGRFRAFLLASLKHFLANEGDKERAQKRGGGRRPIPLDALDAEARYQIEPVDDMTPERVFERRWALAVLEAVLQRLREEYVKRGQGAIFAELENVMVKGEEGSHAEIARRLGMTAEAVKAAGHRLRRRYRELLREEIGQTVAEAGLVDEEIRALLASL